MRWNGRHGRRAQQRVAHAGGQADAAGARRSSARGGHRRHVPAWPGCQGAAAGEGCAAARRRGGPARPTTCGQAVPARGGSCCGGSLLGSRPAGPVQAARACPWSEARVLQLLAGGSPLQPAQGVQGDFFGPTVLTGVTPDMAIWREEVPASPCSCSMSCSTPGLPPCSSAGCPAHSSRAGAAYRVALLRSRPSRAATSAAAWLGRCSARS